MVDRTPGTQHTVRIVRITLLAFVAPGMRAMLAALATVLVLAGIVLAVSGAAEAAAENGDTIRLHEAGAGSLLVKTAEADLYRPLPTVATEVDIRVSGIVARARV